MSGIFISYRHEGGYVVANHLVDRLKRDGYKTIIDKEYKEGDFHEKITKSIKECDDFILILNSTVFKDTFEDFPSEIDWVREELKQARKYGKNIIPVMLSEFEWPKELPSDIEFVKTINSIRYDKEDVFDEFYNKLLDFLKTLRPIKLNTKNFVQDNKIWLGLLLLTAISLAIYSYMNKPNEPVLLFTGGGSVKGYIQQNYDSTALENGIYMPMPSSAAWPIVAEELSIGPYHKKTRDYYIILLSAEKADANTMVNEETKPIFLDKIGYIAEIEIGESQLQVAYSEELDSIFNQHNPTNPSDILNVLNNNNVNVFSTTQGISGTWKKYNSLLQSKLEDDTVKKRIKRFEKNDSPTFFASPYIILESVTYKANKISDTLRRVKVLDTINGQLEVCPMCVYFVVYSIDKDDNYVVPEAVRSFLAKLGINNFPKNGSSELMPKKDNLIRHYNQTENCFEN